MCKYHMLGLSGTVLTVVQSYRGHVWLIDSQRKLTPFFLHAQISVKAWEGMYLVTQRCPHTVSLLWRLPWIWAGPPSGREVVDRALLVAMLFVLRLACRSVGHTNWEASETHLRRPGRGHVAPLSCIR